jgi:hypothetical protein
MKRIKFTLKPRWKESNTDEIKWTLYEHTFVGFGMFGFWKLTDIDFHSAYSSALKAIEMKQDSYRKQLIIKVKL